MRITKKFASRLEGPIGKKLSRSKDKLNVSEVELEEATENLELAEYIFKLSLTSVTEAQIFQVTHLHEKQFQKLLERQELEMENLFKQFPAAAK